MYEKSNWKRVFQRPDDVFGPIHGNHLIPLAEALRRRGVDNRIGFFLHIPFPAPEVLTTLPVHETLVRMLFAYDLIGFQTDRDVLLFSDQRPGARPAVRPGAMASAMPMAAASGPAAFPSASIPGGSPPRPSGQH